MSAKLEAAYAEKKVLVKKKQGTSGEIAIVFKDPTVKTIYIGHSGVVNLLSFRGVTVNHLRNSNIKDLTTHGIVEIL